MSACFEFLAPKWTPEATWVKHRQCPLTSRSPPHPPLDSLVNSTRLLLLYRFPLPWVHPGHLGERIDPFGLGLLFSSLHLSTQITHKLHALVLPLPLSQVLGGLVTRRHGPRPTCTFSVTSVASKATHRNGHYDGSSPQRVRLGQAMVPSCPCLLPEQTKAVCPPSAGP